MAKVIRLNSGGSTTVEEVGLAASALFFALRGNLHPLREEWRRLFQQKRSTS
jgi:hypothetical protein